MFITFSHPLAETQQQASNVPVAQHEQQNNRLHAKPNNVEFNVRVCVNECL